MKRVSLFALGLLFLAAAKPTHALVIINQGKAEVHVETNTQTDNGNTTTHIETTVNGDHEVFDSSKAGIMHVDIESDGNKTTTTTSGNLATESGEEASPSSIHEKREQKENFVKTIMNDIKNFFKNLFHFF